ncbi:MAG: hypothetical protein COA53_03860 [Rhodobacteraceae bacterium]|nr:MAG: hypothetical protein COA53_03860 [Paracoccaceae bacterium]
MPLTLDHLGLGFFGFNQFGGLVSPSDFMSMIGDLFPDELGELDRAGIGVQFYIKINLGMVPAPRIERGTS